MFEKIDSKLTEALQKFGKRLLLKELSFGFICPIHLGSTQLGKPLFNPDKPLKEAQWKRLEQLQKELDTEYDIRRQMLITRLDVTIQSFQVKNLKSIFTIITLISVCN